MEKNIVAKEGNLNFVIPPPNTVHFQYEEHGRSIILYPSGVIAIDGEECTDSELIVSRLREWAILQEKKRKERYSL